MLHFGNFAVKGSSGPSSAGRPGGARRPCMAFVGRLITKTYDFIFEVLQIHPQANFGQASRGPKIRDTNINDITCLYSGSFSAVSKPNFASKYSFETSWRDLQDLRAFPPLQSQKSCKFSSIFWLQIAQQFANFHQLFRSFSSRCWWNLLGISRTSDTRSSNELLINFKSSRNF